MRLFCHWLGSLEVRFEPLPPTLQTILVDLTIEGGGCAELGIATVGDLQPGP